MIDRNLLLKASDASIGVAAAQAAVEDAKRAVEEARAAVEVARQGVSDAKAAYDAALAEITATGVPAAKAKRAVEEIARIFAEFSDDAPVAPKSVTEQKAPRKRKADTASQEVEGSGDHPTAASSEPSEDVSSIPEASSEVSPDTVAEATLEVVAESVTEDAAKAPEDQVPLEGISVAGGIAVDNQETIDEIYGLIESETANEDIFVSETLITILNAANVYSIVNGVPLDIDAYRTTLNEEFVETAIAMETEMYDFLAELRSILSTPARLKALAWFDHVLVSLQNGKTHVSFSTFAAGAPVGAEVEVVEANVDEEVVDDDYTADPDEELTDDTLEDDVTLSLAGVEVEEVENIESINFLESPLSDLDPAPEPVPDAPKAAAPAGGRRPAFLPRS